MVKLVVGLMGSSVSGGSASLGTTAQLSSFLALCTKHGVTDLDTARVYAGGKSEELFGSLPPDQKGEFRIASKAPAFSAGSLRYEKVIENCNLSLKALGLEKIPLYYIHGPDKETPLEEQCRAITQLYKEGKIEQFGVSNLSPDIVEQICSLCADMGGPKPSVYQGGYNALHRRVEAELFPTLRKHDIAFYAWGPLAGGALAKPIEELKKPKKGTRYEAMPIFESLYLKEEMLTALEKLTEACNSAGVPLHEASIRWIAHHSALREEDAVILGASSNEQLEQSLLAIEKGKLDEVLQSAFEQLWEEVKAVANPFAH